MCDPDSSTYSEATEIFSDSLNAEHWYYFAVTGITITSKLIRDLQKGIFDKPLLELLEKQQADGEIVTEVFDKWYFSLFKAFNDKWKQTRTNIMEFNQFFEKFYQEQIKKQKALV